MKPSSLHSQVGVGLRSPHLDYFQHATPSVSWLEIHSENYFQSNTLERKALHLLREQYQISCHGIGLSLGSVSRVSPAHLAQLKNLVDAIEPLFISDHLSWSEHQGQYFNDLLPLPYTEEALNIFVRNVDEVQQYLQRPILIENPSSYVSFEHSTMPEWAFLSEVQRRTQCRLLLDLNNIYVSSFNHHFQCQTYLNAIDANTVDEIHLAGFTKKYFEKGEIWIDTHNQPVCDEVWSLFSSWLQEHGPRHTLIEWDMDLPSPQTLLQEAEKASHLLYNPCITPLHLGA